MSVIKIAEHEEVDSLHPGIGFLSENAQFAEYCRNHSINFIGPSVRVLLNTEGYIGGMPGSMPMYDGAYAVKNSGYSEQMAYGVGGGAKISLDNVGISYP